MRRAVPGTRYRKSKPTLLSTAALAVRLSLASAAVALAGCATPLDRFREALDASALPHEIVRGTGFDHLLVHKPGRGSAALRVYIEGDGLPWRTPELPNDDPTPRTPLAFFMMQRDPGEAIYLGRPCYFGVGQRNCETRMWTNLRYSEAVVSSMAAALTTVLRARGDKRILLIGYSGGGVLATLLTRRVDNVVAVITVGANLDVAGWANAHCYTPLAGSLDPARLRPASATQTLIPELHYVGSDDAVVPPALLHGYARDRPGVQVIEWPGFGHVCCWVDVWPQVLARVGDAAASRPP